MFCGVKGDDLTLQIDERGSHATGADIDCEQQIFCSWGHRDF
jgi:hypothetical protein